VELFPTFLVQLAIQTPMLLAWSAGIVLSMIYWQRYPGVARLTFAACALFVLDALIGAYLAVALPRILIEQGQSAAQIGTVFTFVAAIRAALHAILWGAILFAIFGWRGLARTSTEASGSLDSRAPEARIDS
jgi:hypothetical protein